MSGPNPMTPPLAWACWFWHQWPKWSEAGQVTVQHLGFVNGQTWTSTGPITSTYWRQERTCQRCGMTQHREVSRD